MAYVKGTNNSETINLFDGVTFGHDSIYGYDGNDPIWGLGGGHLVLSRDALAALRNIIETIFCPR